MTRPFPVTIKIDASPIVRAVFNASPIVRAVFNADMLMRNMAADVAGKPRPPRQPYPKRHSGMTARGYRADRRRYQREMKAYKRALRTWTEPTTEQWWRGVEPLLVAALRAKPKESA